MNPFFCCICGTETTENNILLNGDRYHEECYQDLLNHRTVYDDEIKRINDQGSENLRTIRSLMKDRSIFEKIFAVVPDKVHSLREENKELAAELGRVKQQKKLIVDKQEQKLSDLYDYWPERPPDWYVRSMVLRGNDAVCEKCGRRPRNRSSLHVHHKVPISKGGNHSFSNLDVICSTCHQKEHRHSIGSGENRIGNTNFKGKLDSVEEAQRTNKYLSFKYRRYEGGRDSHFVKIEKIFSQNNLTYFRGYCVLNHAERDFRVDKIYNAEVEENKPSEKLPLDYIKEALKSNKILHFHYKKSNGDKSIRSLKPTGFTKFRGVRVLGGFDYLTQENRNFSPHRMSNIEIVDEPKASANLTTVLN